MPIKFEKLYTKELLEANPRYFFVFGDNYEQKGRGGQAKVCRDQPNAIGIPTKRAPNNLPVSYLDDSDYDEWLGYFKLPSDFIIQLLAYLSAVV